MTEDMQTPPPEAIATKYDSLTDYYEARLLHQAGRLDEVFFELAAIGKECSYVTTKVPFYGAAYKAQKLFKDSLETLRRLETIRNTKKTGERTIEGED